MAQQRGAVVTNVILPLDFEAKIGGQFTYCFPFCRVPRDWDNLMIALAGPAVSIITGDPFPLSASSGDFKGVQAIIARYPQGTPSMDVVLELLDEVIQTIHQTPGFMDRVTLMAQEILEETGRKAA
ncbi:hypothetical protein [Thalassospira alkalitolerans]|uniref:hypothetical protein n=1 Tax=Thalassospira alkalitolerans TaxID=1293890 RepID=UPI003AA87FD7